MSKVERQEFKNQKKRHVSRRNRKQGQSLRSLLRNLVPVFPAVSCQSLKSTQRAIQKNASSVIVDEEPDVCEEYAIEYYPTVIMFKKGKVYRRLDAEPGVGLDKKQLKDLTENT